ncbi:hypothetical protein ATR1_155d0001, partial [Acetobacter tropicalis]
IAPKLDIHPDTLSKWTRLHERRGNLTDGVILDHFLVVQDFL